MVKMNAQDVVDSDVLFHALDLDDSGSVGIDELLAFAGAEGAYWADWAPAACAELAGVDPARTSFTREEFCAFFAAQTWVVDASRFRELVDSAQTAREIVDPYSVLRCEAAFHAMDIDDSGFIEIDELVHFGSAVGAGWPRDMCLSLLGRIDTDGDSRISLLEFETFISEVGMHGMHDEVAAFVAAGDSRRSMASDIGCESNVTDSVADEYSEQVAALLSAVAVEDST